MCVLGILWRMEKTIVNDLIMLDCMVNIMISTISTFQQSPFYRGMDVDVYCSIHLMLFFATSGCNRLIPVSIVIYRYSNTRKYFSLFCNDWCKILIYFFKLAITKNIPKLKRIYILGNSPIWIYKICKGLRLKGTTSHTQHPKPLTSFNVTTVRQWFSRS